MKAVTASSQGTLRSGDSCQTLEEGRGFFKASGRDQLWLQQSFPIFDFHD